MVKIDFNKTMEALNKSYTKSVLTRLSGLDLLSGSVSECMCKLYDIDTLLPDCEVELSGCHGLHRKHGLYLQCGGELHEGDLCKKCTTKASNSSYGKPPHGLIEERRGKGPSYIAPDGSKAVSFANVAEELSINLEDAKYYAESLGWVIPESELVYKEKKRGRPKKEKKEDDGPVKKRGRPKKEEIIKTQDDLIDEMVSQIEIEYEATEGSESKEEKKAEKERIKQEKKAEKDRIKQEKKAEKDRIKQEKKEEKDRIKQEKKAEKDRIKEKKNGSNFFDSNGKVLNVDIKEMQPEKTSISPNESKTGVEDECSNDDGDDDKENILIDGDSILLDEGFSGIVTRINGVQYIITNGFPGDESSEKEKIVWLLSVNGEVESIGELLEGGEIDLF